MEPSGHCPYLGLKQNRAIRFASPTTEHRCYVSGDPIDIPVDQGSYCLSQGHIHCPLYTGSMLGTTQATEPPLASPPLAERPGLRGWMASLSPRDRGVYALMLGLLSLIAAIYIFLGAQSLFGDGSLAPGPRPAATAAAIAAAPTGQPTAGATGLPATPTALPTRIPPTAVPAPQPTDNVLFPPTAAPTDVPAETATTAAAAPTTTATPTSVPAPAATGIVAPPTSAPTSAPATAATATALPPTSAPTQTPATTTQQPLTLFFGDASGTLYVPVQRQVLVADGQVASAAVNELIAGPSENLVPLLLPSTELLGLEISGGTATVNFDRWPSAQGDLRGYNAVVLTLTQFTNIQRVQFQVGGQNIGIGGSGPVGRPVLNVLNPEGLEPSTSTSEFLPLYFPLKSGEYDVRIIRLAPKTNETARATMNALLAGPGSYASAVQAVIPRGTELRDISIDQSSRVITVDFSQAFASATNREAATRNIVQSLTTLPNVRGVQILVEGQPLADQWGEAYRNGFGVPTINPE
ncbi:MAG: GerMN domain-containing protein [Roseiflexaceae bacterium]|nr:GerMN domain-containing protein [Roseiflexaceae bacterium]